MKKVFRTIIELAALMLICVCACSAFADGKNDAGLAWFCCVVWMLIAFAYERMMENYKELSQQLWDFCHKLDDDWNTAYRRLCDRMTELLGNIAKMISELKKQDQ